MMTAGQLEALVAALGSLAGASDQRLVLLEGAEQSIVLPIAH